MNINVVQLTMTIRSVFPDAMIMLQDNQDMAYHCGMRPRYAHCVQVTALDYRVELPCTHYTDTYELALEIIRQLATGVAHATARKYK